MTIAQPYKTTVPTAADSFDLTTVETVKTRLGITVTDHDETLAALVASASTAVANYCNRVFAEETLVDNFRTNLEGGAIDLLLLSRRPVSSITTIVEDDETLESDEYEFEAASGKLWRLDGDDERQNWANAKIVVTYVAGYELLDDLPNPIEEATIETVKQAWFAKARDPMVRSEEVPGVYVVGYALPGTIGGAEGGLPGYIESMLDPYREPVI